MGNVSELVISNKHTPIVGLSYFNDAHNSKLILLFSNLEMFMKYYMVELFFITKLSILSTICINSAAFSNNQCCLQLQSLIANSRIILNSVASQAISISRFVNGYCKGLSVYIYIIFAIYLSYPLCSCWLMWFFDRTVFACEWFFYPHGHSATTRRFNSYFVASLHKNT